MTAVSWICTQYFVFLTWLVFRIEDTSMLIRSMKSFVGWDSYWDIDELVGSLPYIKITTGAMVVGFAVFHATSGYVGGGKYWLARRNPVVWGIVCGIMAFLCIVLRPSEAVDFIYFRF